MNMQTRNKLFAYLAGAALSVSAGANGSRAVQGELASVPESLLDEILDEVNGNDWKTEDRLLLLSILAEDKRPQVRMRVSELLDPNDRSISFEALEPILFKLALDDAPEVRGAVARTMADELLKTEGLTRTRVVTEWALSASPAVRDTIARALSRNFFCLGATAVAEHLAADPNPEVRAAAVGVAAARLKNNPVHYLEILQIAQGLIAQGRS